MRESIEKSIVRLEQNGKDFYQDYSSWITEVLSEPQERQKDGLQELIASLTLEETKMKLALAGVNRKEPVLLPIAPAPRVGRVSN